MSMTVGQGFTFFLEKLKDEDRSTFVSKTIFYSLRPKWVKILAPHDVCASIYHENFDFLIKVYAFFSKMIIVFAIFLFLGMEQAALETDRC